MIVRAIDANGDWTFGQSLNNYITNNTAIQQNIRTRLLSFLGDCFFDINAGINWFSLIGYKNEAALSLAISSTILNTANVTGILQLSIGLTEVRSFSVTYQVQTIYSVTGNTFQYNFVGSFSS